MLQLLNTVTTPAGKLSACIDVHRILVSVILRDACSYHVPTHSLRFCFKEALSSEAALEPLPLPSNNNSSSSDSSSSSSSSNSNHKVSDGDKAREKDVEARAAGTDLILPLIIYSVVKTNPPRLVSNLRYTNDAFASAKHAAL